MGTRRLISALCHRPAAAHALARLLDRLVIDNPRQMTVLSGPLSGVRIFCEPRRHKYFWLGTFEPSVQEAMAAHMRPGARCWDVGAFIGFHSLLMSRVAGASGVISIEPDPMSRHVLESNLVANGYGDAVILPYAIAEAAGRARLSQKPGAPSETVAIPDPTGPCLAVTLDMLLDAYGPPDLVKLDVEGAELRALEGAPRLIGSIRPAWIIELHGAAGLGAVKHLVHAGYTVSELKECAPGARELFGGGVAHVLALHG